MSGTDKYCCNSMYRTPGLGKNNAAQSACLTRAKRELKLSRRCRSHQGVTNNSFKDAIVALFNDCNFPVLKRIRSIEAFLLRSITIKINKL